MGGESADSGDIDGYPSGIAAAPHDDLLGRFVGDMKRRGLPDARMPAGHREASAVLGG
jgi:hypothetical protein